MHSNCCHSWCSCCCCLLVVIARGIAWSITWSRGCAVLLRVSSLLQLLHRLFRDEEFVRQILDPLAHQVLLLLLHHNGPLERLLKPELLYLKLVICVLQEKREIQFFWLSNASGLRSSCSILQGSSESETLATFAHLGTGSSLGRGGQGFCDVSCNPSVIKIVTRGCQ